MDVGRIDIQYGDQLGDGCAFGQLDRERFSRAGSENRFRERREQPNLDLHAVALVLASDGPEPGAESSGPGRKNAERELGLAAFGGAKYHL